MAAGHAFSSSVQQSMDRARHGRHRSMLGFRPAGDDYVLI
jgi:hypothetical protein